MSSMLPAGPALYAEELVRRGAKVTGCGHSGRMVEPSATKGVEPAYGRPPSRVSSRTRTNGLRVPARYGIDDS
jgi:hypothetical protein